MLNDIKARMQKSIASMKTDFTAIRTGRANTSVLDHVQVEYYGSMVPISQVANLSVPEPRMIQIAPWEKKMIAPIEKAILTSDLGLNPSNDGIVVRLIFPELTGDRRKELVKQVKALSEKARVSVRNIRRDANDEVKKLVKDKVKSEDEGKKLEAEIQKVTDQFIAEIDHLTEHKEKEIMTL